MNVADLLETSFFQGSKVETATEAGLRNEATWVCPSSELRTDRWVMPGVVIICVHRTFEQQKEVIQYAAKEVFQEYGIEVEFEIGTMIEIPRAALTADRIATEAQYFSFGTNDLTQMTFGYSRDDIAKKILKVDPFQVLDQKGVGKLIKYAVKAGREVRPELRCGICGEHGGEPSSVKFCAKIGMNYASCSPFRVPIARLAAAQAAVEE